MTLFLRSGARVRKKGARRSNLPAPSERAGVSKAHTTSERTGFSGCGMSAAVVGCQVR